MIRNTAAAIGLLQAPAAAVTASAEQRPTHSIEGGAVDALGGGGVGSGGSARIVQTPTSLTIGSVTVSVAAPRQPELVPDVLFFDIPNHLSILEDMLKVYHSLLFFFNFFSLCGVVLCF